MTPSSELNAAITLTLQQLKESLFKHDFLLALEEEEGLVRDIFKLLNTLALHELPASMVKYFVEFEDFFT